MKKLYKVSTNARPEMIYVDYDEHIVRIYGAMDGWQLYHSVDEVEDTSSWDDDFNFDDIVADLESIDPDFKIIEEREIDE